MFSATPLLFKLTRTRVAAVCVVVCAIAGALAVTLPPVNPMLLVTTALVGLAFVLILAYPDHGLILLIGTVTFIELAKRLLFIAPPVGEVEYLGVKLLPTAIIVALAVQTLWSIRRAGGFRYLVQTPVDAMVLVFFLWNCLEIVNPRNNPVAGFGGLTQTGLPILLYFVAATQVRRLPSPWYLPAVLLVLGLATGLYGVRHLVVGMTWYEQTWLNSGLTSLSTRYVYQDEFLRVFGTFASHKEFGDFMAICLLLTLVFPSKRWIWKMPLSALFGVMMFFTFSRASYMLVGVALVAFVALSLGQRWAFWGLAAAALASPFGALVLGEPIVNLVIPTQNRVLNAALVTGTFSARVLGWQEALSQPRRYFDLIGQGLGSVWVAQRLGFDTVIIPHNGLLEMSFELGLVGVTLFFGLVVVTWLYGMLKTDRLPPSEQRLAWSVLGFTVGLLIANGLANYAFQMYSTTVYFWVLLGLFMGYLHTAPELVVETSPWRHRLTRWQPLARHLPLSSQESRQTTRSRVKRS